MSNRKQRIEKDCLNCGAEVEANYCTVCGQENVETRESAWQLVRHFFEDITHFDGKFFRTTKYLITKPGCLSTQYKLGKRTKFLNPVRMYIFTSFVFFFTFFSLVKIKETPTESKYKGVAAAVISKMDSTEFAQLVQKNNDTIAKAAVLAQLAKSKENNKASRYKTRAAYDSALQNGKSDDNWVERQVQYRLIELDKKYKGAGVSLQKQLITYLLHTFPQLLFISLPLFALWLHLLYIRRKDFNYVDNAIFSIHNYIFILLSSFLMMVNIKIQKYFELPFLKYLSLVIVIVTMAYMYKAMRNFYGQRRAKTIFKFLLAAFGFFFIFMILIVFFTGYSLFNV